MEHLAPAATAYLRSVYDARRGLFPVTTELVDGRYESSFEPLDDALRYTITCLLGLQASAGDQHARIAAFAGRHGTAITRPSDAGLLLVLLPDSAWAEWLVTRARKSLERDRGELNAQDLAWMLWGAVAAARESVRGAEPLSEALFERLAAYVEAPTGLPHHRPVRRRAGMVSFGAIAYFLRAVHEYAALTGSAKARALFRRGLHTTLRTQLPDGGWPWLLHARTGAVLERYPLYTVHQLSMSLLFLVPALGTGALGDAEPLERSMAWARGANELGLSMVSGEPAFMARAIERRDPWPRAQRYARAAASRTGRRARQAPLRSLRVNRQSHAYEWGWLLLASAEYAPVGALTPA